MEERDDRRTTSEMMGRLAYQMKDTMTTMYAALQRVAPADARDADGELDENAAMLTRNFFRLRRLAANLEEAADLDEPPVAPRRNDDIVGLCRTVTDRAAMTAELLGVTLEFRADCLSHIIAMDAERIERLILNLLSNAFKFTKRGGRVTVEVRVGGSRVELSVSDTGCGISEERMQALFDPGRGMEFPADTRWGMGLGLPISRKIAADHGGSLVVFSREGEGTNVVVTLENRKAAPVLKTMIVGDYAGGFNRTLMELSDVLPKDAFRARHMD